jgi:hypothetical protein
VKMREAVFALTFSILSSPLFAGTLAGVTLSDTITIGNQTLLLNGMGIRTKFFIKVYVGGLYLETQSGDAASIIQSNASKRVVLHFVYGEVTQGQMVESFSEGFRANAADQVIALKPQIDQFIGALEDMKRGDELIVTYLPATGTTLTIRGKDKLTIAGQPFAQAVFSVWLGPKPPTSDLKNGLLGKK